MRENRVKDALALGRARREWRAQPKGRARVVRRRAELSQAEVANALNVDPSAVSRWEAGQRMPRPDVLAQYLDLLDRLAVSGAR